MEHNLKIAIIFFFTFLYLRLGPLPPPMSRRQARPPDRDRPAGGAARQVRLRPEVGQGTLGG